MLSNAADWLSGQPMHSPLPQRDFQNAYTPPGAGGQGQGQGQGQHFEIIEMAGDPGSYNRYSRDQNPLMDTLSEVGWSLKNFLETPAGKKILVAIFCVGAAVSVIGSGGDSQALKHVPIDSTHEHHQFVPLHTRQHIAAYPHSAQALAVDYVLNRPDFHELPLWRHRQLLALTTYWFGLHPRPKNHMIAHLNECEWLELFPQCNAQGMYTTLKSDKFTFHPEHEEAVMTHGTIPPQFALLKELKDLTLANHSLTGTISPILGEMTALTGLHLFSNSLMDTIPTELGLLTHLHGITLHQNNLIGTIPTEFGRLTALRFLNLGHNELSGTIPSVLGQLTHIQGLALQRNYLEGTFPTELGRMTDTNSLLLDHNRLKGRVPSEIGKLKRLSSLSLQTNDFSGYVPSEMGLLTKLTSCHFHENEQIKGHHSSPLECMHFVQPEEEEVPEEVVEEEEVEEQAEEEPEQEFEGEVEEEP